MKRTIIWIFILSLLAALAGCGGQSEEPTEPVVAGGSTTAPITSSTAATQPGEETDTKEYSFMLQGKALVPGAAFDESTMPAAASIYQVPSCAIEGTDNVYNYETIEVTVFDDGKTPVIYSIYVLDANTPTPEGLYLGDDLAQAEKLYGKDYTQNGAEIIYESGKTQLRLILDGGYISSIEYRMVT